MARGVGLGWGSPALSFALSLFWPLVARPVRHQHAAAIADFLPPDRQSSRRETLRTGYKHPANLTFRGSPGNNHDRLVARGRARGLVPPGMKLVAGSVETSWLGNAEISLAISGTTRTVTFTPDGTFIECS